MQLNWRIAMTFEVLADAEAAAAQSCCDHRPGCSSGGRRSRAIHHGGQRRPYSMGHAARPGERRRAVGQACTFSRSMSVSLPTAIPTATSPTCMRACSTHAPISREQIHAMPVEMPDLEAAAKQYARTLTGHCGRPGCARSRASRSRSRRPHGLAGAGRSGAQYHRFRRWA